MASADQIGRGILLNEDVDENDSATTRIFDAGKGANSVHLCCHITGPGTPTATWLIQVEDPTTEKETTFTGLTQKTYSAANTPADNVEKDTIEKYNFIGGPGSRVRCTVTVLDDDATVKIWAWSSY